MDIIHCLKEADLQTKGVESNLKDGAILKELVFKIVHSMRSLSNRKAIALIAPEAIRTKSLLLILNKLTSKKETIIKTILIVNCPTSIPRVNAMSGSPNMFSCRID